MSERAAAANAPAVTAAQDTPDAAASVRAGEYESYATVPGTLVDITGVETAGSDAIARVGALMFHLDAEVWAWNLLTMCDVRRVTRRDPSGFGPRNGGKLPDL